MTENPYAAPEQLPRRRQLSPATIAIHSVSRAFRMMGWGYLFLFLAIVIGFGSDKWRFPKDSLFRHSEGNDLNWFAVAAAIGAIVFLVEGCIYIRVGRRLLLRRSSDYRIALILSVLMIILPPLGMLCLWQLHEHWKVYCEEQTESVVVP